MKAFQQKTYDPPLLKSKELDQDGKSKAFQLGFYILSSVGLEKLLETEIQPFPSVIFSLSSSSSEFIHRRTNQFTKKKPKSKKKKKGRKHKENEFGVSNRRPRKRSHAPPMKKDLKNQSLTVSVNDRQSGSYTFHDGVVEFLQRALRFLAEARSCSPQQLVSRILFNLAETLGETLDKPNQKDLERAVNEAVRQAQANGSHRCQVNITPTVCLDRSVSGVIVSYKEHGELGLSSSKLARVKRGMHFDIPLRPFEATVEFPKRVPRHLRETGMVSRRKRYKRHNQLELNQRVVRFLEEQDTRSRMVVDRSVMDNPPCSPQSFPPSPVSREEVLSHFDEHTQNVLYRVRDELRSEQQDNDRARKATFNIYDTHDDIVLSKGGHCCTTKQRLESFCSCRAMLPIQFSRSTVTYFEFEIDARPRHAKAFIGLSTRKLPLSCLTGSGRYSIGMNLSGRILKDGQSFSAVLDSGSYAVVSTSDKIGVCTKINGYDRESRKYVVKVAFFINGRRVFGQSATIDDHRDGLTLMLPEKARDIYPTVTLYSQHTAITGRFAAEDMANYLKGTPQRSSHKKMYWLDVSKFADGRKVLALDGNAVY